MLPDVRGRPLERWWVAVAATGYVGWTGVFHYLANLSLEPLFLGVQARFWQQSNMPVLVMAGVGLWAAAAHGRTLAAVGATIAVVYGSAQVQCALLI